MTSEVDKVDEQYYLETNAIMGPHDSLYKFLRSSLNRAKKARFLVAFITESGARLLAKLMAELVERGGTIEILTGTYLNITEPYALEYLLDKVTKNIDIRAYNEVSRSFHAKAYFFDYQIASKAEVFVGSANLSWTALTSAVEWAYRLRKNQAPQDYQSFLMEFERLFALGVPVDKEFLRDYQKKWQEANR